MHKNMHVRICGSRGGAIPHGHLARHLGLVGLIGMVFDVNSGSSWYTAHRFSTHTIARRHTL